MDDEARSEAINEAQRQKKIKRNVRITATVLWLIVATIFFYVLAKYYWQNK
jgi:hypothetical protein